jgi:RNA polymerase sigma-70 factor (ECF subfamily)
MVVAMAGEPDDSDRAARAADDERRNRALEQEIRTLAESSGAAPAATRAIEGYGGELLGYLFALARTPDDAEEMFAELCEKLWRALPQFRWDSSFRTWAYAIARNLVREAYRQGHRRHVVALADAPEVAERAAAVRTTTVAYMRSDMKRRLEMLREALDEDDRTLLVLRVDRRMAWRDIARVMSDAPIEGQLEDLDKLAATLRKRFERVKERLRSKLGANAET